MSIDFTEQTTHIGKRKNRSELFVKDLFDENNFHQVIKSKNSS
jgi:hypothetical protein